MRRTIRSVIAMMMIVIAGPVFSAPPLETRTIVSGLDTPWSMVFLPDGSMLVSERPGRLRVVSPNGVISVPVEGVPTVYAQGQGGLFGLALSPDFAQDSTVFFSFAQPHGEGARTAVARARLDLRDNRLTDVRIIFAQNESPRGGGHFGGRLALAPDDTLFVTLGDRYAFRDHAQYPKSHLGKIVRIRPDGSVPDDNPYAGADGFAREIWSYGHRNVQGAAIHPVTGRLWAHEHGPQGGDEVNIPEAGGNHGWPVITYGREYVTGFRIGAGEQREDVVPPRHYWVPSIAPSGMSFYTGEMFPEWRSSVFVGSLKFGFLVRLELRGDTVVKEERLLEGVTRRIRDVVEGPDGALYLLDESGGRIVRVSRGSSS